MRVLVTGGTGVVGKPAVDRLLARGHTVRLLSRNAESDARQWPERVEPFEASVGDREKMRSAADGCDAVLHVAGIVAESPPEVTFQRVNVEGTRYLVEEAERAGVRRFIYLSSLGAERGTSDYHRSKFAAEAEVQRFRGSWVILRPGNVYGPGDEVISLLLRMVRSLPAIPVIGGGDQPFQPVWADDLGEAIARAVERDDSGKVYLLAGPEQTDVDRVLDVLAEVTGKRPARLPVPSTLAQLGTGLLDRLGVEVPVNRNQLIMLEEENVIRPGEENALITVFGIEPTPLVKGITLLADSLPEQLSDDGVGELHRQRFWADVRGSRLSPAQVMEVFRREFSSLTPDGLIEVGTEPGTGTKLELGATLTLDIPLRGTMQVRVQEMTETTTTMATVSGHLLAGVIRFDTRDFEDGRLRFEIVSYTRASNWIDYVGRTLVGRPLQQIAWQRTVERVIERTGGTSADGVQTEDTTLSESEAERIEGWAKEVVMQRKREEVSS